LSFFLNHIKPRWRSCDDAREAKQAMLPVAPTDGAVSD
jgi:hypothetical protein